MKKLNARTGFNLFIVLAVFSLVLSACGPGGPIATGGDGTIIWIDQPMTNFMLPIAPFTLIAHAGHPGAGITQVNFLVNGVSVGVVPADPSLDFLRSEISWNPSGPGLYTIQAQATSPGGLTYSHISSCLRHVRRFPPRNPGLGTVPPQAVIRLRSISISTPVRFILATVRQIFFNFRPKLPVMSVQLQASRPVGVSPMRMALPPHWSQVSPGL